MAKTPFSGFSSASAMTSGFAARALSRLRRHIVSSRLDHLMSEDPYVVLGAKRTLTNDQLKALYRRCVAEVHPDRIIARGYSPDVLRKASDRLALVNAAWKRIKDERGIS
jgi:DnaJ like chaperone protein